MVGSQKTEQIGHYKAVIFQYIPNIVEGVEPTSVAVVADFATTAICYSHSQPQPVDEDFDKLVRETKKLKPKLTKPAAKKPRKKPKGKGGGDGK